MKEFLKISRKKTPTIQLKFFNKIFFILQFFIFRYIPVAVPVLHSTHPSCFLFCSVSYSFYSRSCLRYIPDRDGSPDIPASCSHEKLPHRDKLHFPGYTPFSAFYIQRRLCNQASEAPLVTPMFQWGRSKMLLLRSLSESPAE